MSCAHLRYVASVLWYVSDSFSFQRLHVRMYTGRSMSLPILLCSAQESTTALAAAYWTANLINNFALYCDGCGLLNVNMISKAHLVRRN